MERAETIYLSYNEKDDTNYLLMELSEKLIEMEFNLIKTFDNEQYVKFVNYKNIIEKYKKLSDLDLIEYTISKK